MSSNRHFCFFQPCTDFQTEYFVNRPVSNLVFLAGFALAVVAVLLSHQSVADESLNAEATAIRAVLDDRQAGLPSGVSFKADLVRKLYSDRDFRPVWTAQTGVKTRLADFRRAAGLAEKHGLNPDGYPLSILGDLNSQDAGQPDPSGAAKRDILTTYLFLSFASDFVHGRVDPKTLATDWIVNKQEIDFATVTDRAAQDGRIFEVLENLLPKHEEYRRLVEQLANYRLAVDNQVPAKIGQGETLRIGATGDRVQRLRNRLVMTGDLPGNTEEVDESSDTFDSVIQDAVITFQHRHGLDSDGIVGKETQSWLDASVSDRIKLLRVNLERWRWLPRDLGQHHIRVNIAGFYLEYFKDGEIARVHDVIVGREFRKTPIFSERMSYLVFSPTWTVPPGIARKDKVPAFRKDPTLVEKQNFDIYDGWGEGARRLDSTTINWEQVNPTAYRIVQRPGPDNALGDVKFMFPNQFHVYLHDTPARELFSKSRRAFSSGCIRVKDPLDLAEAILNDREKWSLDKIQALVDRRKESTVSLQTKLPVHLLYWTAWVDDDNNVQVRKDIYERDDAVFQALDESL